MSSENTIKGDYHGQCGDALILVVAACLHLLLFFTLMFVCFLHFLFKGFLKFFFFKSVLILLRLILFFKGALILFFIVCCVHQIVRNRCFQLVFCFVFLNSDLFVCLHYFSRSGFSVDVKEALMFCFVFKTFQFGRCHRGCRFVHTTPHHG